MIAVIASASIREHARRKLIIVFIGVSALVAGAQIAFILNQGKATLGPGGSFALAGFLGLLGLIATLAVSMGNIGRPFADGEAMQVLVRPVTRWQYALGRLGASVLVVAFLCFVMGIEMQVIRFVNGEGIDSVLWGHWAVTAYNLTILAAITTLVSIVASAPAVAAIIAFFIDRFIGAIGLFYRLVDAGQLDGGLAAVVRVAWLVTPKQLTSPLVSNQFSGLGQGPQMDILFLKNTPGLVLWSVTYLAGLVLTILVLVNRKEVKG